MELKDFLDREYRAWQYRQPKRASLSAWAEELGVPQSSLSKWLAGVIPDYKNLDILAARLGSDVYRLAGVPERLPRNENVVRIARFLPKLPVAIQERFADMVQDAALKGGEPDSDNGSRQPN